MAIKVFLEAAPLVVDLEFPEGIEQGGCLTIVLTSPGQKLVGEDKSGIQFSHVNNEIIPVVRTVTVEDDLAACIQTLQKVKIEAAPLPSGKLPCIVRLVPKVYSEKEAPPDLSFPPIGKVLDCLPGSPTMFPAGSPDQSGASSEQEDENDLNFQVPAALGGGRGGLQDLDELSLEKDDLEDVDSPMPEGPAANPNALTCTVCDYTTESGDDLRYHIRLHAVQGELCCKVCQQQYRTLADFKEHCDSHAPAVPPRNAAAAAVRPPSSAPLLFCGTCGKVFRSQAWLNRHIEKRHGATDDADQEADAAETSAAPGRGPPTLQCCACARTFTSASLLQAHERSHFEGSAATDGGDYACGLCDRSFTSYRGLRMHQRKHLRENRWAGAGGEGEGGGGGEENAAAAAAVPVTQVATTVGLDEADASVIEQAYETVPAESFMEAPLTAMDAVFSEDVVSALRAVGMDCDEGTTEVVAAAMAASEPVAEVAAGDGSLTKYPCPLCGKLFERALKRDHHVVRKHTKAYPLQCTMCRRGFMFRKNLDRHFQDSHSGHYMVNTAAVAPANPQNEAAAPGGGGGGGQVMRSFKCNYCAFTGITLGEIQGHLVSHPEIRFFACEGCDKEFSSEVRYQRHVERGLCQQRPQCDECGKCLSSQTALRNHRLCHGQDRAFACDQCGEAFKTGTTLKYHQ